MCSGERHVDFHVAILAMRIDADRLENADDLERHRVDDNLLANSAARAEQLCLEFVADERDAGRPVHIAISEKPAVGDGTIPHILGIGGITRYPSPGASAGVADFLFAEHHAWPDCGDLVNPVLDGVEIRHLEFVGRYENRSGAEHPVDLVRDLLFGAAAQRTSHDQRCDAENDADAHEEAAQFEACQVAQTATH